MQAEQTTFFLEHHLYLKEWLTDKLWLFRLEYFVDIFFKMNDVNLSLYGKQVTIFVVNDDIWVFKLKLEFLKNFIFHHELESFPQYFDKINGIINTVF